MWFEVIECYRNFWKSTRSGKKRWPLRVKWIFVWNCQNNFSNYITVFSFLRWRLRLLNQVCLQSWNGQFFRHWSKRKWRPGAYKIAKLSIVILDEKIFLTDISRSSNLSTGGYFSFEIILWFRKICKFACLVQNKMAAVYIMRIHLRYLFLCNNSCNWTFSAYFA